MVGFSSIKWETDSKLSERLKFALNSTTELANYSLEAENHFKGILTVDFPTVNDLYLNRLQQPHGDNKTFVHPAVALHLNDKMTKRAITFAI